MLYADTTGQKAYWFLYDESKVDPDDIRFEMVGVDKAQGHSITLKPGDFIQLSEIEIMGMHNRSVMKDGTLIRIDDKKMKEILKAAMDGTGFITANEAVTNATSKDIDDVEVLNRAADVTSKSMLKRILKQAQDDNRGYQCIKKLQEMVDKATKR